MPALRVALALALLMASLPAACRRRESAPAPAPATASLGTGSGAAARTVRDGLGRELHVPRNIRRVVSLAPSSTEIVCALGAGPLLVGLDRYSDFPPSVATVERVGVDLDPSLERIIALRPDVVFTATSANGQKTVDSLTRAGIPVYVSAALRLDAILEDIRQIGAALGRPDDGEALTRSLRQRIDAVKARAKTLPRVRSLIVVWPDPLLVAGGETHADDLIRAAGGDNIASDSKGWPTFSVERVIAAQPEVLIVGSHEKSAAHTLPPALRRLSARLAHSRVSPLDGDVLFRPGPRVVDGLEALFGLLHPPASSSLGPPL